MGCQPRWRCVSARYLHVLSANSALPNALAVRCTRFEWLHSEAGKQLAVWLDHRPHPQLLDAWEAYATELSRRLQPDDRRRLREDIVNWSTRIAHTLEKTFLRTGGPTRAEFAYQREGDEIVFSPAAVWYYGAAGEEYKDWNPVGKSPEFTIKDSNTGRVLASAIFPGTC